MEDFCSKPMEAKAMRDIKLRNLSFNEALNGQLIVWRGGSDIGVIVSKTQMDCEILWFRHPEEKGSTEWFDVDWFDSEAHNITTPTGEHEYDASIS